MRENTIGFGLVLGILLLILSIVASCTSRPNQPSPASEAPTSATGPPSPNASAAAAASPSLPIPPSCLDPKPQSPPAGFSLAPASGGTSSSPIVLSADGSLLLVANADSASVTLVRVSDMRVVAEVRVGKTPRTVAIGPDQKQAYVANYGDGTVSVVDLDALKVTATLLMGHQPYGVVAARAGVFVSDAGRWEVVRIDPDSLTVTDRVPVEPFPTGLALTGDGEALLVSHLFTGRVSAINTKTMDVLGVASTGGDTNISQYIGLSPDGRKAYLPQTRSNATNRALLFDTTVFPVINVLDLSDGKDLPKERVTLDTADRPVDLPIGAVLSPDGKTIYVANAGSNDLSVIDLASGRALQHIEVGAHPRGLSIAPDGSRVYVNNALDGTVTAMDVHSLQRVSQVQVTAIPLPPDVLLGKQLFHLSSSERTSKDQWISCAVCHFDGGLDARTWLGFPDGPRNTPSLVGVGHTMPVHWSGDLDELQDAELTVRVIQAGKGLIDGEVNDTLGQPNAGRSPDLDALAAFMSSLDVPLSPCLKPDASLTDAARHGEQVFTASQCNVCHTPPFYTDKQLHEVGTGDPATERNSHGRGTRFDTPSLLGVWATAPYFHDGSAGSLREVLAPQQPRRLAQDPHAVAGRLSPQEIDDLVTFLRSLPYHR